MVEMLGEQGVPDVGGHRWTVGLRVLRTKARIDLRLPTSLAGMNGRQLPIRRGRPDPVSRFSHYRLCESVAISDGFLQPGMEMITKPFDLDNLSQRFARWCSS